MRRIVVLAMLAVLCATTARAQEDSTRDEGPTVSQTFGIHYGTPLRASLAAGVLIDRSKHQNDGLIVMLEQGFQGSEVSAGYFRMFSWFGSGYSLRAVGLRTGDEPWNASPHTTYVGGEAHMMIAFGVGGRVGYLRRASRSVADPHDTVLTAGISIGH